MSFQTQPGQKQPESLRRGATLTAPNVIPRANIQTNPALLNIEKGSSNEIHDYDFFQLNYEHK